MQVKEYMSKELVFANLNDGLHQTFTRMQERGIRHMPVLGEDEKFVGIISDRDLRRPKWLDENPNLAKNYRMDNALKVSSAMTQDPIVVHEDDPIKQVIDLLIDMKYGALPVLDKSEKIVGIISTVDVLKAVRHTLN